MKMAENITEQYTGTLNDMERCGALRNVGYERLRDQGLDY